jgi:hypothetical protein
LNAALIFLSPVILTGLGLILVLPRSQATTSGVEERHELVQSLAELSAMIASGMTLMDLQTVQIEIATKVKLAALHSIEIPKSTKDIQATIGTVQTIWDWANSNICRESAAGCVNLIRGELSQIGASAGDISEPTDIVRSALTALGSKTDRAIDDLTNSRSS